LSAVNLAENLFPSVPGPRFEAASIGTFISGQSAGKPVRINILAVVDFVRAEENSNRRDFMINGLFTHYASGIFMGAVFVFALSRVVSSSGRYSRRREKPDPPSIFGPIRGMYVCYQCDTIFNTTQCPQCHEEASIPLIHLTGSVLEDERVASVLRGLNARTNWKLPPFQNEQAVQPAPASVAETSNGEASEVPVRILFSPQRGRELS
jgi:hypothetical protein